MIRALRLRSSSRSTAAISLTVRTLTRSLTEGGVTVIDIKLQYSLVDSKNRLRSFIGTSVGTYGMEEPPPFVGGIYNDSFWLYKRRTFRNSFAPVFYGRMMEKDGVLKIEGFFAVHPTIIIMMIGLTIYALLSGQTMFFLVISFFLILGVPLFLISVGDQDYIKSFLQENL